MKIAFAAIVLLAITVVDAEESCSAVGTESQTFAHKFDSYKLTYFDGRGLAEVPRTLLAMSGRFPGAGFEDVRMTGDMFKSMKTSGDLAKNLGRAPVLNHNGEVIGQSAAVARYLAQKLGFNGVTDVEAAHIDTMCEHIVDIKAAHRKVFPYGKKFTDEEKKVADATWFDTPASPELEGKKNRQLQWYLGQVEGFLKDGYSVGGRPSLADAYFFNMLAEHAPELGAGGEPFGNLEATTRVLKHFPQTTAVVETFKSNPGIKHYLATRVKNSF